MKKKPINYLGFLSLLSLISILGYTTDNTGFYGFLGFLYYIRYFKVIPDELFKQNLQKASTAAWFSELIFLDPLMFLCHLITESSRAIPTAFGLSFAFSIVVFSAALILFEYREHVGAADD